MINTLVGWLVRTLLLLCILAVLVYAWAVWENNRNAPMPDRQQVKTAFESAVGWVDANQDSLLKQNNPALWWMIRESARLTGNQRLQDLFDRYHRYLEINSRRNYQYLWFRENGWAPVRYEQISSLDDYQQFFAYALTCDQDLADEPLIAAQTDADYCVPMLFKPSCVTHQMIGLMLLGDRDCGDKSQLTETITVLQRRVRDQLIWDPRVVDPYIQRVLLLLLTDAADLLKPVWIERVINAAQEDGGWPSNRVIINLPGKQDLAMTRNLLVLGKVKSTFHATAQGLLIMALLMNNGQ
jgi:hypothetical protein